MATIITGAAQVLDSDYRYIKWAGKTKSGLPVIIELEKAFCNSNPDWTFAEKDDTTAEVEFEGCYEDANLEKDDLTEPWKLTLPEGLTAGNGEIVLGVGKIYIGASKEDAQYVGLTRGGGSFIVERNYREINADDDPGKVAGRVVKTEGRPKLKLVALQWLSKVSNLYACVQNVTE